MLVSLAVCGVSQSIYVYIISYDISYLPALAHLAQMGLAKNKKEITNWGPALAPAPVEERYLWPHQLQGEDKIRGPDAKYNEP